MNCESGEGGREGERGRGVNCESGECGDGVRERDTDVVDVKGVNVLIRRNGITDGLLMDVLRQWQLH